MTLRDRVGNAVAPPLWNAVTEPEFWLYIGLAGIGFVALVTALNAVEAPTLAVLAVGMVYGWLTDGMERRLKDRIDARREDPAGKVDE